MSDRDNVLTPPNETPWGKPISSITITDGIQLYHTPSHGGLRVHPRLYVEMPERYRVCSLTRDNWFEEDGAACAVALSFPQHFDEYRVEIATDIYQAHYKALETQALSTIDSTPKTGPLEIAEALATLAGKDPDLRDVVLTMPELRPVLTDAVRTLAQQAPTAATIETLRDIAEDQFRHTAREFDNRRDIWEGLSNKKWDLIYPHRDFAQTMCGSSSAIPTLIQELAKLPLSQNVALALGSIALIEMREGEVHARQIRLMRDLMGDRAAADAAYNGSIRRLTTATRFTANSYSAEHSTVAPERDNSGR